MEGLLPLCLGLKLMLKRSDRGHSLKNPPLSLFSIILGIFTFLGSSPWYLDHLKLPQTASDFARERKRHLLYRRFGPQGLAHWFLSCGVVWYALWNPCLGQLGIFQRVSCTYLPSLWVCLMAWHFGGEWMGGMPLLRILICSRRWEKGWSSGITCGVGMWAFISIFWVFIVWILTREFSLGHSVMEGHLWLGGVGFVVFAC